MFIDQLKNINLKLDKILGQIFVQEEGRGIKQFSSRCTLYSPVVSLSQSSSSSSIFSLFLTFESHFTAHFLAPIFLKISRENCESSMRTFCRFKVLSWAAFTAIASAVMANAETNSSSVEDVNLLPALGYHHK